MTEFDNDFINHNEVCQCILLRRLGGEVCSVLYIQMNLKNAKTHGDRKKIELLGCSHFPDQILHVLFVSACVIRTFNVYTIHIS